MPHVPAGRTALTAAAEHGLMTELHAALGAGAAGTVGAVADERDGDGFTALTLAACFGHLDAVRALLAAGANVDAGNQHGKTPLMYAAEDGHAAIIAVLLEHHADPNLQSAAGTTALAIATSEGHDAIVRALQAAGARR